MSCGYKGRKQHASAAVLLGPVAFHTSGPPARVTQTHNEQLLCSTLLLIPVSAPGRCWYAFCWPHLPRPKEAGGSTLAFHWPTCNTTQPHTHPRKGEDGRGPRPSQGTPSLEITTWHTAEFPILAQGRGQGGVVVVVVGCSCEEVYVTR